MEEKGMKPPEDFTQIVNKKRYSTKTAILLAGDDYWDGHNYERRGTNTFLYRTKNGAYFWVGLTQWQGDQDELVPVDVDQAYQIYERMQEKRVPVHEAFPDFVIEDA